MIRSLLLFTILSLRLFADTIPYETGVYVTSVTRHGSKTSDGIGLNAITNTKNIAIDKNGVVYFTDNINNKIQKITADGMVTTIAGGGR